MGIREVINQRPKVAGGVAAGLAGVALLVAAFQVMSLNAGPQVGGKPERAFFTVDDGANWFVDDASRLAPFQHEGKEAVRAYVAECNGKRFVNHVERYTPEGMKAMIKVREAAKKGPPPGALVAMAQQRGREVRRPGVAMWTPGSDGAAAAKVMAPVCTEVGGEAKFVFP